MLGSFGDFGPIAGRLPHFRHPKGKHLHDALVLLTLGLCIPFVYAVGIASMVDLISKPKILANSTK